MRAAATLMHLGLSAGAEEVASTHQEAKSVATVVCDLGCGDGEFRKTTEIFPMFLSLPDDSLVSSHHPMHSY
jgi:hypothetical protein